MQVVRTCKPILLLFWIFPNVSIAGDDGDGDITNCLLPGNPTTCETVTFTNTTTNAVSYLWNFGDGQTSTQQSPTHTYTTYGTFTVTMTATHANGCTATATLTVVFEKYVSSALTLDITEYSGCTPHPLTKLSNLSVNANTYTWNFVDGSALSSNQNPFHLFPANGTYQVELIVTNSFGCTDTIEKTVTVNPNPVAAYSFSTACFSYPTIFTDASVDAISWSWNFGNGSVIDTSVDPVHLYPAQGNYPAQLIVTNIFGCKDTLV